MLRSKQANRATVTAMNLWVYKCNRVQQEFASAYGDWDKLFRRPVAQEWGGSWCTANPVGRQIINERMQPGDLVLAYQTDARNIVGLCI